MKGPGEAPKKAHTPSPYAQSAHNKANRPKNPADRTGSRAAQQTLEIG
jgi:hypothetical protein